MQQVDDSKKPEESKSFWLNKNILEQTRIIFIWINLVICLIAFVAFGFCLQMSATTLEFIRHTVKTDINLTALEKGKLTKGDQLVPSTTACICILTLGGCLYISILMIVFSQPRHTLIGAIILFLVVFLSCILSFILFGPINSKLKMISLEGVYSRMFKKYYEKKPGKENSTLKWGTFNAYWLRMQEKYHCCGVKGKNDFKNINETSSSEEDSEHFLPDSCCFDETTYLEFIQSNNNTLEPKEIINITEPIENLGSCKSNSEYLKPACGQIFVSLDRGLSSYYLIQLGIFVFLSVLQFILATLMFKCYRDQEVDYLLTLSKKKSYIL